jgi:hypothetical protein
MGYKNSINPISKFTRANLITGKAGGSALRFTFFVFWGWANTEPTTVQWEARFQKKCPTQPPVGPIRTRQPCWQIFPPPILRLSGHKHRKHAPASPRSHSPRSHEARSEEGPGAQDNFACRLFLVLFPPILRPWNKRTTGQPPFPPTKGDGATGASFSSPHKPTTSSQVDRDTPHPNRRSDQIFHFESSC